MPLPTPADLTTFLATVNTDAEFLEPRALTDKAIRGLRWRGGRKLCVRYDHGALREAFVAAFGEGNADGVMERELRRASASDSAPFVSVQRQPRPEAVAAL